MPSYTQQKFTTLPPEIVDAIAFELAVLQPLGPPSIILPLLSTCRSLFDSLSPRDNLGLWARIFRHKFDTNAVERRDFTPTQHQCVEQLMRYCRAMQVLRSKNPYHDSDIFFEDDDLPLDDALMTAVVMMLEDDGKNVRQLCEWAHVDRLASDLVHHSMFREMHSNNGWPLENRRNACAVWLMWLLTSQESLKNETPEERSHINAVLLPFVTLSYRYPTSEVPPLHFQLPFHPTLPSLPTTINTAHGPYPVWPSEARLSVGVHYNSRPNLNSPLLAPAAKLLFFSRQELTPLPTPPHLARNRAELVARGNTGVGPTMEDMDEFNWGWSARLPQGPGVGPSSCSTATDPYPSWRWGVGDSNPLIDAFSFTEDEAGGERLEKPPFGVPPAGYPNPSSSDGHGSEPPSRWAGKAPHNVYAFDGRNTRSRRWDADWWRLRLCGDPRMMRTRVPYGKLYEPGSIDGLWHGRFLMPAESEFQNVLQNPLFPGRDFNEENMRLLIQPFYIRFNEAHGVSDSSVDLGVRDGDEDENMNNAWFDGNPGSTRFHVRHALEGEGVTGEGDGQEVVEIAVTSAEGRQRRGVFPCWKSPRQNLGLGNAGVSQGQGEQDEKESWKGYPHDPEDCEECQSRLRVKRQLEWEAEDRSHRERAFASVGLGMEDPETDEDSESTHSYDSELDELEPVAGEYTTPDGVTLPALPRTHDRAKLAYGKCDGIREVYVVGETDKRHQDAWGGYEYYGRVREWDGLIGVLARPKRGADEEPGERGYPFFYGYLVGGENWVGSWRFAGVDGSVVGYEGAFVMSKRND